MGEGHTDYTDGNEDLGPADYLRNKLGRDADHKTDDALGDDGSGDMHYGCQRDLLQPAWKKMTYKASTGTQAESTSHSIADS